MTSKGQVTIPLAVREELGLRPGDEVEFVRVNGHFRLKRHLEGSPFQRWHGFLKEYAGRNVDQLIEEMRGP
jgi:AbrB family looped-hinge helix DNA binding protein